MLRNYSVIRRFANDVASTSATQIPRGNKMRYKPVIGLEVHVQLLTKTKLFSRAANSEGSPNRRVAPFDMATPGILPLLNRQCVLHAIKMGLLLDCEIPNTSRFDRKHYFYADMPAGYQITQNEMPIAKNGKLGFYVFDETIDPYWKEAQIIQLQLEQDSGKTIHIDRKSLVDYNRAGCALVEIVTTPCFSTALEAVCFVQHLRLILMHYGLCGGELHKGHMRVDANISLSFDEQPGVRTEIKNMNSIRCIHTAINYEIARQFKILDSGGQVVNETLAADSDGRTVSMRDKEVETDYRFMVEPNLPILKIRPDWLRSCRDEIEHLGRPVFEWLRDEIGFDARTSLHICDDPDLLRFVSNCIRHRSDHVDAGSLVTWMRDLKTIMQRSKHNYPPQSEWFAEQFVELIGLFNCGKLTRLRMLDLIRMYSCSTEDLPARQYITENNYWRIQDKSSIRAIVASHVADPQNANIVEKCRKGHAKSFNKLRNSIVEKTEKRIEVDEIVEELSEIFQ